MKDDFSIAVLGPIGLIVAGEFSAVRGQQGAVLATLAASYPQSVEQAALIDIIWPVGAPASAKGSLGVSLHRLRSRLPDPEMIVTEANTYRLSVDAETLDLARFRHLIDHSRSCDAPERIDVLAKAIDQWRGRPFQPIGDDPAFSGASAELLEMRRQAEEELVEALLEAGRAAEASNRASSLVDVEPYRERRWELLMLSLYRSSQQTEALRAAQRARQVLGDDLGIEPGPAIQELEAAILSHDPSLLGDVAPQASTIEELVDVGAAHTPGVPVFSGPFIGRSDEMRLLGEAMDSYPMVEITGAPGVGKSRLASRYCAAGGSDLRVLWLDTGEGSVDDVASRMADMAGVQATEPIDDIVSQLAVEPTLVVLDGAAAEHLPIVRALRDGGGGVRTLLTGRESVRESAVLEIGLDPLDEESAVAILQEIVGVEYVDALRAIREIGTIPRHVGLFGAQLDSASLDELLLDWREPDGHGDDALAAALDWSVGRLTVDQRSLYEELGVFAGWNSAADIAGVAGRSTGVVRRQLRALHSVGLVRTSERAGRSGRVRYRLDLSMRTHALALLDDRSGRQHAERQHIDYFFALAKRCGADSMGAAEQDAVAHLNEVSAELHLAFERMLDRNEVGQAIEFILALREYSFFRLEYSMFEWPQAVFARADAIDHERFPELLAVAAHTAWAVDRISVAGEQMADAVRLAHERNVPVPLTALRAQIAIAATRGDGVQAIEAMADFEAAAGERGSDRDVADALVNRSMGLAYLGDREGALGAAHESLSLAERSENPSSIAWAKFAIGTAELLGNPEGAILQFGESLRLARTVDNKWIVSSVLGGLATGARRSGRAEEAIQPLAAQLETWIAMRKERFFARVLNEAALVLVELDRLEDARSMLGWAGSYTADPMILPDDRQRVRKARSELAPPLMSEVFDIAEHARIARRLLLDATESTVATV